ncbi:hypothetical protein F444_14435 [Phytophthora nicotianae P1976]|uniref:M96 mating-specific protein family n=1 Tax=Phytophthora nicotianae P1976 TaxID=1317066 RepID=A0A080ZQ91_PHYNI|nr:hypothetical protein F444_14435 [Phytophthora nicotianae P1976]
MAFLLEEEDNREVLEAALSFVDEFGEAGRPLSPQDPRERNSTLASPAFRDNKASRQATKGDGNCVMLVSMGTRIGLETSADEKLRAFASNSRSSNWIFRLCRPGEVATQQRRQRSEAEGENVRLKLAVQRQQKMADDLKSLLQRKARQLSNECASLIANTSRNSIVNIVEVRGDLGDFQQLFRHLEAARQEVDAVFAANGLANMVATPSDIHIREGDDGKYLEAFSNKLLAFRLQAVTEALWSHFKSLEKHAGNGSLYQKAEKYIDESNTILEDFTMEMHSNTSRADIKVKQVIRRYVEADRDIIIWVSRVSPVEIKHRMLRGLTYHLRGHAIAKRSSASTPRNELSQLQFCSLISFDRETHTMYDHNSVGAALNFLLINTAQKMKVHQDRIENILVEQVLQNSLPYK